MRNPLYIVFAPVMMLSAASIQAKMPPTAQIQCGREYFVNSPKGTACKTCHQMGSVGPAIAPDLTTHGVNGSVHSLVMAMHMKQTENVTDQAPRWGPFRGILKSEAGSRIAVYDLSKLQPEVRAFSTNQIISVDRDEK
jgi:hypothetical protein